MSKHSIIKRLFSATLAFIVLVTSVGIALDFHMCQGELKSIGVFEEAIACSNMEFNSSCDSPSKSQNDALSPEPCCKNSQFFSKLNIEKSEQAVFELKHQNLLALNFESRVDGNVFLSKIAFQAIPLFRPPPIEKDFSTLFQTFLI